MTSSKKEEEENSEEGLTPGEVEQLNFLEDLMNHNQVALRPSPPTKGSELWLTSWSSTIFRTRPGTTGRSG